MAMSKAQRSQWPWNNAPSKRHVWKVISQTADQCGRCGFTFLHRVGGRAAVYCHPTPQWLATHPDDDRKEG